MRDTGARCCKRFKNNNKRLQHTFERLPSSKFFLCSPFPLLMLLVFPLNANTCYYKLKWISSGSRRLTKLAFPLPVQSRDEKLVKIAQGRRRRTRHSCGLQRLRGVDCVTTAKRKQCIKVPISPGASVKL